MLTTGSNGEVNISFLDRLRPNHVYVTTIEPRHKPGKRSQIRKSGPSPVNNMASKHSKTIATFGKGASGTEPDIERWGIKGSNLIAMANLGIPVPPGFVLGIDLGKSVAESAEAYTDAIKQTVRTAGDELGERLGRPFGDLENPLLISVRSGAAVSMPGMMDTVLNLGLNSEIVTAFGRQGSNERFAWDTYRRLIQSYAQVVLGLDLDEFELVLEELRAREDCASDAELSSPAMREAADIFMEIVEELSGHSFPQDPYDQLDAALLAVFKSWNTPRATRYRDMHGMAHEGGTAGVVQAMVFGNRNERSCTGVYFTRNPSTGEKKPYGEYMLNAQGEEVVSGIRTPRELTEEARIRAVSDEPSMERLLPDTYAELIAMGDKLEHHFGDMKDIEFTVDDGSLWLLQTRSAKRTPKAAVKAAVAMVDEGIIDETIALSRCDISTLAPMMVSRVEQKSDDVQFAKGLAASPGAVSGRVVFSSDAAVEAKEKGIDCILVRPETDPKDVHGINAAAGILTSRGGLTSHAAVVARGMNKPCITAAMTLKIDLDGQTAMSAGKTIAAGDTLTVDGASGIAWLGEPEIVTPEPDGDLARLLSWRDDD